MSVELAYRLLQMAGVIAAFVLALQSFQRRSIQLGDEPTLPRYFAPATLYRLGMVVYAALIAFLFLALISVWMPIRPLFEVLLDPPVAPGDEPFAALGASTILPGMLAAVFLFLVSFENRLNPVLLLRDAVYDTFATPRKALDVYNALRVGTLDNVDQAMREQCMARLLNTSLEPGDFDKASDTVEYKWARACVLFDQISTYANEGSYRRFFKEPSLKWGQICISVNETSEKVANWKAAEPHYTKTLELLAKVDHLVRLLCRLLACLVVYGSGNDREMWESVVRLGGDPNQLRLKHTYKYLLIFTGAIVLAVILGREFAVALYNRTTAAPLAHFEADTFRWILYAVSMYILPIALVFIARVEAYRSGAPDESRYWGFYTLIAVACFIVSTAVSALVFGLAAAENGEFSFAGSFIGSMRFGILPALMCGFVAFQMDNPAAEDEPKRRMYAMALVRLVAWAFVGLVVILYATDDLPLQQPGLRYTMVITTVFVSALLGAVARFKQVRTRIELPPAAAGREG